MDRQKPILIRYGELALKSEPVRADFERLLVRNIRKSLKAEGIKADVKRIYGRIIIKATAEKAKETLKRVFGIVSFSFCESADDNITNIIEKSVEVFRKSKPRKTETFKVETNRVGSHPYTSQAVNEKVGAAICKKFHLKVNLSKPGKTLYTDIRDKTAYIFTEKVPGPGGFPIGSQQGRLVSVVKDEAGLLSTWLLMKRGAVLIPVFAGLSRNAVKKYSSVLEKWNAGHRIKYHMLKNIDYKEINKIIEAENALGAVLPEIGKADKKRFKVPVFYPLIGFSEKEIKEKTTNIWTK